jgi:recA bacterial DNA recombination protein
MAKTGALHLNLHYQTANQIALQQAEPKFLPLPAPGFPALLSEGLARGILAEVYGKRSSGRTSAALHLLAQSSSQGEICAVVDLYDSFDPASAAAAGVRLDRLLWVRCGGNAEHAMRAADLLLHAGGFGMILLDLCEASPRILNRIPLSYWYRFRRAIEQTPTILLLCADMSQARSASLQMETKQKTSCWSGEEPFLLLRGLEAHAVHKLAMFPPEPLQIQVA